MQQKIREHQRLSRLKRRQPAVDHLARLPDELLLHTASSLIDQPDLYALSLTCRRLRNIGQEVLYSYARVVEPNDHKSNALTFLRTLLERSELAKMVRHLHLITPGRLVVHWSTRCSRARCLCGLTEIKTMTKAFMRGFWITDDDNASAITLNLREGYVNCLDEGYEPTYGGIILMLVPNLESLYFGDYGYPLKDEIYLGRISSETLFGMSEEAFCPTRIPGLRNLKYFRTDGDVPYNIVDTSKLTCFELGFRPVDRTELGETPGWWKPLENTTRLVIHCDIRLTIVGLWPGISSRTPYLATMMKNLLTLRHLTIYLEVPSREHETKYYSTKVFSEYDTLLGEEPTSPQTDSALETLIVDTSSLGVYSQNTSDFLSRINPSEGLFRFPALRHVRAPQDFLMDRSLSIEDDEGSQLILRQGEFHNMFFPMSMEAIEVTDVEWETMNDWGDLLLMWVEDGALPAFRKLIIHGDVFPDEVDDFWRPRDRANSSSSGHRYEVGSVWGRLRNVGIEVEQGDPNCGEIPD